MRTEVIQLITKTQTGAYVTERKTEIFAEKKSVNRTEFYAAASVGLNVKKVFLVDKHDYEMAIVQEEEPGKLEYNEKVYAITRTYEVDGNVEIVCGEM